MSGHFKTLVSSISIAIIAQAAVAQDLTIAVDVADLEPVLRQASLVATVLSTEDAPLAQDLIAAARADYQRIIAGLYSEGYYGGTVSIRIDGREAASIAPLDAPETVGAISIEVNAGQRFTFGQVSIAPLADGTVLPDGFATGQTARSGDVKAAVAAAVAAWRAEGHAKAAPTSQQITARHSEAELNVAVGIDAGPQVSFGPLTVSGNEDVRTDAITRIVGYRQGTVFSPDEAEKLADRLRRTGAFSSVAVIEGDTLIGTALPIELLDFSAEQLAEHVELNWITSSEINNSHFIIERSIDTKSIDEIARVEGAGNSNSIKTYSTSDMNPMEGISYYRLKQVDFNGDFSHSEWVAVNYSGSKHLEIEAVYFDQANGSILVRCSNQTSDKGVFNLIDATGRLITTYNLGGVSSNWNGSIPSQKLMAGSYILRFDLEGKSAFKKFVVH